MPELPEVETIVSTLRPLVRGRRIRGVELRGRPSRKSRLGRSLSVLTDPSGQLLPGLSGAVVDNIERYGKNIVFQLRRPRGANGGGSLWIHLGMTGRLTVEPTPQSRNRHTQVVFRLDKPGRWLHYSDMRQFGCFRWVSGGKETKDALGPDPLEISFEEFFRRLHGRRRMLKSLLLQQDFLRGIGNIYADESLFRAGVHPATQADCLSRRRALRLYGSIRETLALAIQDGGSSIANYVNAQGRRGNFQEQHQVYGRAGEPCRRCGARIRKMLISSRGTHFCPRCQNAAAQRSRTRSAPRRKEATA